MLLLSTILSILLGRLRGGSFEKLAESHVYGVPAILLVLGGRVLLFSGLIGASALPAGLLHTALFVLLVFVLGMNRHIRGMTLAMAGAMLNAIVIAANGGRMPVSETALRRAGTWGTAGVTLMSGRVLTHTLLGGQSRLSFLGDVLWLRWPWGSGTAFSIGDVLLIVGVFIAVQHMMGVPAKSGGGVPRSSRLEGFGQN